jgi:hypothetical protein
MSFFLREVEEMKRLVLLVAVLGFACLFTGRAFGDILNVPTAEYPNIQAGIDAASSGDTVQVAPGTYHENITMKSGVVIQGAGQGISIIDGGGNGFLVTASSVNSAAKLDGFTITNVNATYFGMYNYNSSPTVTNCTFSGNSASNGGGMFNFFYSSPTVSNCTFSGNSASNGGGMYNIYNSSPTVTNCTFSENTASDGGGMYNESSSPVVTNCTFSGNSAVRGGGMQNALSSATVTNCTFSGNTATTGNGLGGGMYNLDSSLTVTNCTFSGNSAGAGGGGMMNDEYSSSTVTNCTFSRNNAFYGGGMYNYNHSWPAVTNCTFSGNSAVLGGGMYNESSSSPTVTNNILWEDSPDEIYNLGSSPIVTYSDIQGGFTGTGNIDADPKFVDAANEDYHLQQGSPCIDTGTPSGAPATDLEGNPRPQGAGYDMGAYEFLLAKTTAMPWILLLLGD